MTLVGLLMAGAWLAYRGGRPKLSLCLILVGAAVLRVYASSDGMLHAWDERFHALVAKHLSVHPLLPTLYATPALPYDPGNWLENRVWLHKPPLALWLMASSMKLFGISEFAVRLPSIIVSLVSVVLTYSLAQRLFGTAPALLAAAFHALNGMAIELAAGRRSSDHVDSIFIGLVELGIWLAFIVSAKVHSWDKGGSSGWTTAGAALIGVIVGAALLTKSLPGILVIALWVGLLCDLPARRIVGLGLVSLVTAAAVTAPWTVYTLYAFPTEAIWESGYNIRHLFETLEGQASSPAYYFLQLSRFWGELIFLPILWFSLRAARFRNREELVLAAWIGLPLLVFTFAATKMPAYMMVAAPSAFIMSAVFCCHWKPSRVGWIRVMVVSLVVAMPVKYCVEAVRPFRVRERHPAWVQDLRGLTEQLGVRRAVVFGVARPIEGMFYTDYTAYSSLPDEHLASQLIAAGWTVAVCRESEALSGRPPNLNALSVRCGAASIEPK